MSKTHISIQLNYMTPKQAAEFLNLSLSTIKNYIYSGVLKSYKTPGGHHRIKKEDLVKVLH
ncbi:MAG: helix-turn-helix domain-containing protein [Candidatus Omnitrophica bacterium]|nr:helix-turn-helix domain-containing protein [Candidatus Omnitrophota bacterium]